MDTLRVNVCYRPLRIGWLVRAGDAIGFRQAVSLSHALWGGRYNPILTVDREEESRSLIERFRVDLLLPASTDEATRSFAAKFPHLINPIHSDSIFGGTESHRRVEVLDVQNLLTHIRGKPERQTIIDKGFRLFAWEDDDPLSDLFLIQLGRYPSVDTSGIDYRSIVARSLDAVETKIDRAATVPVEIGEHPSIAYLPRHGLEQHHSVYGRPDDYPGFFLGHADNLDDLICFWNLRACDIPLWFVDPRHVQRYRQCLVNWEKVVRESIAHRNEWERHVGVWRRQADLTLPADLLPHPTVVHVEVPSEQDFRSIPPTMHFGEASALGVLERGAGAPKVSFSLNDKPFSSEIWFYPQRLVASIAFLGGLYDDDAHTLQLPYLPELNEFFSREMLYDYSQLRVESERIGVVIGNSDSDESLNALSVAKLINRVLLLAKFDSQPSTGGLIARQLITRVGGLQGSRVFKIPGVRRLIKTYGPAATFSKGGALQQIGSTDLADAGAKFSDHEHLYIAPREHEKLTKSDVFSFLIEKGLLRLGRDLTCPECRLPSWYSLDNVRQRVTCELCGQSFEALNQLVDGEWAYRRSGILGAEKNSMGAIPVALTLQQLDANFSSVRGRSVYATSLDLKSHDTTHVSREIDFVWLVARPFPERQAIVLGECKDVGPIPIEDFKRDVDFLVEVADALPAKRFDSYVLVSKLAPFTDEEVQHARSVNIGRTKRVILLSAKELEPYRMYERSKTATQDRELNASSPRDLAAATDRIYWGSSAPKT